MASSYERAKERLKARVASAAAAKKALYAALKVLRVANAKVGQTRRTVKRLKPKTNPGPWMPNVERDPQESIGPMTVGNWRGLLHTTEGTDFDVMDRVLKSKRACPHFLVGKDGRIRQYMPVNEGARALANLPGGVETNRARCVQIEVCGFAREPNWPAAQKDAVRRIVRFCELAVGIPRVSTVVFRDRVGHLSPEAWLSYRGWLGHQHCPENDHFDPGPIDIHELLRLPGTV